MKQDAVVQVRDEDVDQSVAIDVARKRAHRRDALSVLAVRHIHFERLLDERALAGVLEVVVLHRVVSHEDVQVAVVVEVGRAGAHAAPVRLPQAGLLGDVGERAVAVVAVENVGLAVVAQRTGIARRGVEVAELAVVVLQVVADVDVEQAVVVVVEPDGREAPALVGQRPTSRSRR